MIGFRFLFAFLALAAVGACSRTPLRSGDELFGVADGGPPGDAGPDPTLRCDWSWGRSVPLRSFGADPVAEIAFDAEAPTLRVHARPATGFARRVWTLDALDFEVTGTFDPDPSIDPTGARLFGLAGAFLDLLPAPRGCTARTLDAAAEEEITVRASAARARGCFAYVGQPDALVVAYVGPADLSLHAFTAPPLDVAAQVGPFPGLDGRVFAWRDGAGFRGLRLAPGGRVEALRVTGGLELDFAGNTAVDVQFAPDPDRDRAFFLESRGDGTATVGVVLLGDPPRIDRFPGGVAYRPDPDEVLPLVAGDLVTVDGDAASVAFVPANGASPAFLDPPEPGATGLKVAVQPASDRAAAVYSAPDPRGTRTLFARELVCRR